MKLQHPLTTPRTKGAIVAEYLKVLAVDTYYDAWTVTDAMEVMSCAGIIKNNGSYNPHTNTDESEHELFVAKHSQHIPQWFTLKKAEAEAVCFENLKAWKAALEKEIDRINELFNLNYLNQ